MYFIIIYIFLGIVITILAIRNDAIKKENWYISYPLSFILWPILFIVAWDELLSPIATPNRFGPTSKLALSNIEKEKTFLTAQELLLFKFLKDDISENNITEFDWYEGIKSSLELLWDIDLHPSLFFNFIKSKSRFEDKDYRTTFPRYSTVRKGAKWYFGLTDEFIKSLRKVDRKTQGRILEAIKTICENPMELKGDTNKPLSGSLEGLWRYRIGDFRLIFQPNQSTNNVLLLSFSSRGSAYK